MDYLWFYNMYSDELIKEFGDKIKNIEEENEIIDKLIIKKDWLFCLIKFVW